MKHSEEFLKIADDAKSRVKEISVKEILEGMKDGANGNDAILLRVPKLWMQKSEQKK